MRSRTPADIPTHARTRIRTSAKTHAITHAHAHANVQAHKYTQIRAFARSRANTHKTRINLHARAVTRKRIHIHMQTKTLSKGCDALQPPRWPIANTAFSATTTRWHHSWQHSLTHSLTHSLKHSRTHARTHTHTHTHTHAHTRSRTHARAHTNLHARAVTCTRIIYTCRRSMKTSHRN